MRNRSSYSVGYNTINLKQGSNLLAANWEAVGTGKASLSDILIAKDKLTSIDENFTDFSGDYINTWDLENGKWGATYQYADQPVVDPIYTDCWVDKDYNPVNPELNPGESFWLFAKADVENLTFCGQVGVAGGTATLVAGANLLANAKPIALNLSDKTQVVVMGQTSIDENFTDFSGDYINTWDIVNGRWGATYQYANQPVVDPIYTDCWIDKDYNPVPTEIAVGSGFWYFAKKAGVTIVFQ